jgi:hypothetical protein
MDGLANRIIRRECLTKIAATTASILTVDICIQADDRQPICSAGLSEPPARPLICGEDKSNLS